jgi:NADH-quinone oxidoreductase subunit M
MANVLTLDFLLLLVVLMPVLGIICIVFLDAQKNSTNIKQIVIWTTSFAFIFTTWLLFLINNHNDFFSAPEFFSKSINDYVTIYMVELTAFVFLMGALIFQHEEVLCVKRYSLSILVLEALLFLFFPSTNIVVFYFLLEAISLMMFVAVICASSQLSKYALRLLIISTCGSFFILCGILYINDVLGIDEMSALNNYVFTTKQNSMIFVTFFVGFWMKSPLITIISKVYHIMCKAPASLAIILAGIFMQISNFGFITIPCSISNIYFSYFFQQSYTIVVLLTMATQVMLASVQTEPRCIVASLFVVQMCVSIIGIFSGSAEGISGGFFGMMNVSVIISALLMFCHLADNFMDVNLQHPAKTLRFQHIKIGLIIPLLAIAATPFTPLFIEEILVIYGICQKNGNYIYGVILCGLTVGSLFGVLKIKKILFARLADLKLSVEYLRELIALFIVSALIIIIGIFPGRVVFGKLMTSILISAK